MRASVTTQKRPQAIVNRDDNKIYTLVPQFKLNHYLDAGWQLEHDKNNQLITARNTHTLVSIKKNDNRCYYCATPLVGYNGCINQSCRRITK